MKLGFALREAERVLDILRSEDALEILWVLVEIGDARGTRTIPAVEERHLSGFNPGGGAICKYLVAPDWFFASPFVWWHACENIAIICSPGWRCPNFHDAISGQCPMRLRIGEFDRAITATNPSRTGGIGPVGDAPEILVADHPLIQTAAFVNGIFFWPIRAIPNATRVI